MCIIRSSIPLLCATPIYLDDMSVIKNCPEPIDKLMVLGNFDVSNIAGIVNGKVELYISDNVQCPFCSRSCVKSFLNSTTTFTLNDIMSFSTDTFVSYEDIHHPLRLFTLSVPVTVRN